MAPLQIHELSFELSEDDLPEDRLSHHVNNARYFAFIDRTFRAWYVAMGIRVPSAAHSAMMASTSYDFLRQVFVPGTVRCRIAVTRVGRTSMEHTVEMWDVSTDTPVLAGRGRVAHVWVERALAKPVPWPAELLAKCWDADAAASQEPSRET